MGWMEFVNGVGNDFTNALVENAPQGKTGDLSNSIMLESVSEDGTIIISMNETGKLVEFGTPPHVIEAKNGKSLHWKDKNGRDVFAKKVFHPGTRPNPFIRGTLNTQLEPIMARNAQNHLNN